MNQIDDDFLGLLSTSTRHTNRYVRETAFLIFKELSIISTPDFLEKLVASKIAPELPIGLDDNWSEVRFAASMATREFLLKIQHARAPYMESLIPRMLLNRYYAAQGVKMYSLETWKQVMGDQGRNLVVKYIDTIVAYYISQIDADNFGVREAACHCMGELATRISPEAVRSHVDSMLQALSAAFIDTSWPVRSEACKVCGDFILSFPNESKDMLQVELYQLCLARIGDDIWSVRENAAIAIANLVRAYGDEVQDKILEKTRELLPMAKQNVSSGAFHPEATKFNLEEKRQRDNDPKLHTGQVLFACCTLAPRTKRKIGHAEHGYDRQPEPWESSDGAIYLIRELSEINPDLALEYIPIILEIASLPPFPHYQTLLETIWKQMIIIFKNLGPERGAGFVKDIIKTSLITLKCENRLAMNAAGYAIDSIRDLVGHAAFDNACSPDDFDMMKKSTYVHSFQ